jgi:hypothetical protein
MAVDFEKGFVAGRQAVRALWVSIRWQQVFARPSEHV